jgi:hypothetical protein
MNRSHVFARLEAIVVHRLFGPGPWLADREACDALRRTISEMGLYEPVPTSLDVCRITALAAELNLDLYEVFFGLMDEGEVPGILQRYRLIDPCLADDIYRRMEAGIDAESLLRGYVQRAYFDFHNAAKALN